MPYIDSQVFLCDFHREQAWLRWVRATKNNVQANDKEAVLAMLRNVATSLTEEQYKGSLAVLQQSMQWKSNQLLQRWMENHEVNVC